jgi:hypothetical protein
MKDMKGLHCIRQLLLHPGQELPVIDLVEQGLEPGDLRSGRDPRPDVGLPVLDAESKSACRRRVSELREELAESDWTV